MIWRKDNSYYSLYRPGSINSFLHIVLMQFILFSISSWCNFSYFSYRPGAFILSFKWTLGLLLGAGLCWAGPWICPAQWGQLPGLLHTGHGQGWAVPQSGRNIHSVKGIWKGQCHEIFNLFFIKQNSTWAHYAKTVLQTLREDIREPSNRMSSWKRKKSWNRFSLFILGPEPKNKGRKSCDTVSLNKPTDCSKKWSPKELL